MGEEKKKQRTRGFAVYHYAFQYYFLKHHPQSLLLKGSILKGDKFKVSTSTNFFEQKPQAFSQDGIRYLSKFLFLDSKTPQ